MHRIHAIRAFVILLLALTVLAGTRIGLAPQDLNLVHPLEAVSGRLLDDTTLQRALDAIGTAHQTLLITPGTWTMTDDLTIPAHVNLWLAAGAQFSISAGRTLTINGTLSAPLMPIFSGAGRVVFGGRSLGLHPHWFGASCDGVADDTQALQKTIDAASASVSQRVWLPANANCRITGELLLKTGVEIFGHGRLSSRITVMGAGVRGLVYNPGVLTQAAITLSHFAVIGHDATVGNLIDVPQAGDFYISSLQASTTGSSGIYWDTVYQSSIRNSRIEQAAQHGIHFKSSNTFHIDNVNVQSGPAVVGQSGIYLDACDRGRIQSSALEGYSISGVAIRLNGVSDTDIVDNFLEFYAEAIRAERTASAGIRVAGNHLQATGQVRLEFSIGSLPHERMVFERNSCVLAAQDYCLKGLENVSSLVYENNTKTDGTHFNPVTVSPTALTYRKTAGPLVIDGGLRIVGAGGYPLQAADAQIDRFIATSSALGFDATPANACEDSSSKGFNGAMIGDYAEAIVPSAWIVAGVTFHTFVSAPDTLTIRRCNHTGRVAKRLAATSVRAIVIKNAN